MCEICGKSITRDYTNSKNKHHQKALYKIMKIKQKINYYVGSSLEKHIECRLRALEVKPSFSEPHS